jgi:hypothetical protein
MVLRGSHIVTICGGLRTVTGERRGPRTKRDRGRSGARAIPPQDARAPSPCAGSTAWGGQSGGITVIP